MVPTSIKYTLQSGTYDGLLWIDGGDTLLISRAGTSDVFTIARIQTSLYVPPAPDPTPDPKPDPTPDPAPAGWQGLSGVYTGAGNVSGAQKFASWRGSTVDIVCDFTDRTQADIENPYVLAKYKPTPYKVSLAVWPWPTGGTDAKAATGAYVASWKKLAASLKAFGADRVAIRPGWESNGGWFEWGKDPASYIKWWRLMHDTISPIAPGLLWDFNTVIGHNDPAKLYPGDAYVDIVSIDPYDTVGAWSNVLAGLNRTLQMAKAHGKKVALPEWGLTDTGHYGQGDNTAYIQGIHDWIAANKDVVAFECYFEYNAPDGSHKLLESTFPKAGALYKQLW